MSRTTIGGRTAVAVVCAAALAGSGLVTASASAQGRPGADRSSVTSVRIVKHVIHMPHTIRAGLHTFRVSSKSGDFQVLTVHGRYTKQQFAHDANKGVNGGGTRALKRLERHVTLLGGGEATAGHPATVQLRVPRGTFWVVDTGTPKTKASRIFVGHAVGPVRGGSPTGTATITAVDGDRWSPSDAATIAASGRLLFKNESDDDHFVVFAKLAAGKTMTDFANWVAAVNAGKATFDDAPVDQQAPGFFNAIVSPGHASSVNYALPAGSYAVACFWPDADNGGTPHVFMGMYRGITLQ